MIIELKPDDRQVIKPLYENYPFLRGMVASILAGTFGSAFTDNNLAPQVAHLADPIFSMFAGDPTHVVAHDMVAKVPKGNRVILPNDAWKATLENAWGGKPEIQERCAFLSNAWDRAYLKNLTQQAPEGFYLKAITSADAGKFGAFYEKYNGYDPVSETDTFEEFIAFGTEYQGQFACVAFGIPGNGMLEIDILTHRDFRRKGLATVTGAALILDCISRDIYPNWDAANQMSTDLALKLGYTEPLRYESYFH